MQIDGEKRETVTDFTFLSSKTSRMVTAAMKLKEACSLEEKLWQTSGSLDSSLHFIQPGISHDVLCVAVK